MRQSDGTDAARQSTFKYCTRGVDPLPPSMCELHALHVVDCSLIIAERAAVADDGDPVRSGEVAPPAVGVAADEAERPLVKLGGLVIRGTKPAGHVKLHSPLLKALLEAQALGLIGVVLLMIYVHKRYVGCGTVRGGCAHPPGDLCLAMRFLPLALFAWVSARRASWLLSVAPPFIDVSYLAQKAQLLRLKTRLAAEEKNVAEAKRVAASVSDCMGDAIN